MSLYDADSGDLRARTEVEPLAPGNPEVLALASVGGEAWLVVRRSFMRVGADGRIVVRVPLRIRPTARIGRMVAVGRRVWIVAGREALDVDARGAVRRRVPVGSVAALASAPGPLRRAVGEGARWTLSYDGALTRRDPATGSVTGGPVDVGFLTGDLAVGAGGVWVGGGPQESTIVRFDPRTLRATWRRDIPPT